MSVNYPLLCIIAAAFSLLSWHLIVQEIEAKDLNVYDNPFSEKRSVATPRAEVIPSKPIFGTKNIEHKSISDTTKIDAVGDLDCSNGLHDQIKKNNPDYFIALGDLCYNSDLTEFHDTWNDFNGGKGFACVIGNHDAEEDGNLILFKQAQEFCKDHWSLKVAGGTTLLLGLDTNGDVQNGIVWGQKVLSDQNIMKGVKTVIFFSHKMAHSPPSHHHIQSSTIELYQKIQSSIPHGIEVYEVAAHNHIMAESKNAHWFVSGAGGESHHEDSSTNSEWSFVNDKDYGYLQIQIDNNNGNVVSSQFFGLDGELIH